MTRSSTVSATVLEQLVTFLIPLFIGQSPDDPGTARQAARQTLTSYGAETDREIRLAALIVAFGFGALDALAKAAEPGLPMNLVLRLRGNANALNRAAQQNERLLDKLRQQRLAGDPAAAPTAGDTDPPATALPASSQIPDLLAFARSALQAGMRSATVDDPTDSVVPMSRQQRRAAERQADKAERRLQEQARLAQRAAARQALAGAA